MQVTETNVEGLKRELRVTVAAAEINERFSTRLDELKAQVHLKGFRKGKVPLAHLKKVYGRQLMAEILEKAVDESSKKVISDRNERPAMQPSIQLPEDNKEIEEVLAGQTDLAYDLSFEVLPEIQIKDLSNLKLEKLVAEVDETAIDEAVDRLAEQAISYQEEDGRVAEEKDQVKISFTGYIDGEAFEGGSAEDVPVVVGQGGFIPGFEEGLKGTKAGDEPTVEATFPEAYQVADLAGKAAKFEVKVKSVARPVKPQIDDEFATTLGAEDLKKLREMVRDQIQGEYDSVARSKLKRDILNALEKDYDFSLPPSLVEREFEAMWKEMTERLEKSGKTIEDEGKTEEGAKEECQKLAERRVRLGLLIGEIGDKNSVEVTQEELRQAVLQQTQQFPGQEKVVIEYYEKNPNALMELRAPIFEEKVIDFITELAKPTERTVSSEELLKPPEDTEATTSPEADG